MSREPGGASLRAPESEETVLKPPRTLRWLAWGQGAVGAGVTAIAVVMFTIGAVAPAICAAVVGLATVGAALPILVGQVQLGPQGLRTRRDSFQKASLAWSDITGLEVRRRLWTEWVVALRDSETPVTLGAPVRSRLWPAPTFEAAVADLSRRAGVAVTRGRSLLTWRYTIAHLVILGLWAFVFVAVDPMWHHPSWPTREEARDLPDPCRVIEPAGRQTFPEAAPRRSADSDSTKCEWGTGSSLWLEYTLYDYEVGQDGGIERAKRRFREGPGGPTPGDEGARTLPNLGDEAVVVTSTYPTDSRVNQIQVSARRGNVLIWLVYMPPEGRTSKDAAVATVERLARAAVAEIVLN